MPISAIPQDSNYHPQNMANSISKGLIINICKDFDPRFTEDWASRVGELKSIFSFPINPEEVTEY